MPIRLSVVLAFACVLFAACESPQPGPGNVVIMSGLTIQGPTTAAPGQALQYTAIANFSNGTSENVTAWARWNSTNFAVKLTSPGFATAVANGEALVSASYTWRSATVATPITKTGEIRTLVLAPGTFKVSGHLTLPGGSTMFGKVEVLSGGSLIAQATAYNGEYALYGISGPVQLRAFADNHLPEVYDVVVDHNVVHDFVLSPIVTPAGVAGLWTMTIVGPSPSCQPGFPAIARDRSYKLNLTQMGTSVHVDISSPTLVVIDSVEMTGWVVGTTAKVNFPTLLSDTTGQYSDNFFDHLSATETLAFAGLLKFEVTDPPSNVTFDGILTYWAVPVTNAPNWTCQAKDHVATVRR